MATADPINVDVPAMLGAVQELLDKNDSIRSQVTSLENEFDALSASWQGEAATGFQNAMRGFYDECGAVLRALRDLADKVDKSAIKYENAHHMSTDTAAALQQRIASTPSLSLPTMSTGLSPAQPGISPTRPGLQGF